MQHVGAGHRRKRWVAPAAVRFARARWAEWRRATGGYCGVGAPTLFLLGGFFPVTMCVCVCYICSLDRRVPLWKDEILWRVPRVPFCGGSTALLSCNDICKRCCHASKLIACMVVLATLERPWSVKLIFRSTGPHPFTCVRGRSLIGPSSVVRFFQRLKPVP